MQQQRQSDVSAAAHVCEPYIGKALLHDAACEAFIIVAR